MEKIKASFLLICLMLSGCTGQQANLLEHETEIIGDKTEKIKTEKCLSPPIINPLGQVRYPRGEKYSELEYLGPLFTAYSCGPDRLKEIPGVQDDLYTLGSSLLLKQVPEKSLLETLKSVGFKCAESTQDAQCQRWVLEEAVKIQDLLKLEPYHSDFMADNCRHCQ